MSTLKLVNAAEENILDNHISTIAGIGGYTLRLFRNDVTTGLTPDQIDALAAAAFTEANFAGYAAITFTTGWVTTQGNPTVAINTERTFTRSSTGTAQLIFGYYLTALGFLHWFEQFDAPISIEFINDAIKITPTITLDDVEGHNVESGIIVGTGRTTAPTGWHLCDGAAISRTTFAPLYAAIGTAYGVGDGSTTFNVPDLRQRFPLGKATAGTGATLGGTGGLVDHVHGLDTASSGAKITMAAVDPYHSMHRKTVTSYTKTHGVPNSHTLNADAGSTTGAAGLIGDSGTANPPFQTVNYLIKD